MIIPKQGKYLSFTLILIGLILISSYYKAIFLFFQQDEWLMFGRLITSSPWEFIFPGIPFGDKTHFVPIHYAINYLLYSLFGLNSIPFNIVGLSFHILNGFLIYLITSRLTNRVYGYFAVIFFLSSSIASQLIFWPVINVGTLSLTFALSSWLTFLNVSRGESVSLRSSILISSLVLCSILTLEHGIGLILFIPIVAYLAYKNQKLGIKRLLLTVATIDGSYLLLRLLSFSGEKSNITGSQISYISYLFELPLRFLGQMIVPYQILIKFTSLFTSSAFLAENIYLGVVSVAIGIVFSIVALLFLYSFLFSKRYLLTTPIIFIVCALLPFILLVGITGNFYIIPPRYYYFLLAGFSVCLAILLNLIAQRYKTRTLFFTVFLLLVSLMLFGISNNKERIDYLYDQGEIRREILEYIKYRYPVLPAKVIFYIKSDKSFYGLKEDEKIVPFQSGFGQTLLVWYDTSHNLPDSFFKEKFLWDIKSQGYKEVDSKGFGYFRNYQDLKDALKVKNLNSDIVIAFEYQSDTMLFKDITKEVRQSINNLP